MASIKNKEFAEHVHELEKELGCTGRPHATTWACRSYGSLYFLGSKVMSYSVQIAKIWTDEKVIVYTSPALAPDSMKVRGYKLSATTGSHMRAVMHAMHLLPTYVFVEGSQFDNIDGDPIQQLVKLLGVDKANVIVPISERRTFLKFWTMLIRKCGTGTDGIAAEKQQMIDFIKADKLQRENMFAIYDLAADPE